MGRSCIPEISREKEEEKDGRKDKTKSEKKGREPVVKWLGRGKSEFAKG